MTLKRGQAFKVFTLCLSQNRAIWGNPYLRLLRSQLEQYIAEELGKDRLSNVKKQTELRKIKREIANLKKKLNGLQARRMDLEEEIEK